MPSLNPLTSPPPSSSSHNTWGPYSNAKDFDANMATILIILVLATSLAFALHAAIRFFLRLYHRRRHLSLSEKQQKDAASLADSLPSLVFSPGTKLAGGEGAECAICLTEFVEGDRVRVLPTCNHGFHVKCVAGWLASRSSCPTCRRSCRPAEETPEEP